MGQITVTKVVEGQSHLVIRVDLVSDGTGELENYVILSPSDLNPPKQNDAPAFRIMQIWYGLSEFDLVLKAGTLIPSLLWTVAKSCGTHVDFRSFGGLLDTAVYSNPPSDDDGKLTLSTKGFNSIGSVGSIAIELRKTNQATA